MVENENYYFHYKLIRHFVYFLFFFFKKKNKIKYLQLIIKKKEFQKIISSYHCNKLMETEEDGNEESLTLNTE
jgi:hypothetical protein